MNNPKISVIIPVYNVDKYVEKCLKSIINQTYNNLEIIIVNDGSTDNSLMICEKIAKKDKRIKIITQKNGGLSLARNTGIKNSTGDYIAFIDSDDYVSKRFIEVLYNTLIANNADISVCDYIYVDENDHKWSKTKKMNKIYSNIDAIKDLFVGNQDTEVMSWNKLYKKSLFLDNNILFPEGMIHEDNFTTYKLYYFSKSIALVDEKLYFYLQRNNSIMGKKFNVKRLNILLAIDETKQFFEKKKIDLSKEILCYKIKVSVTVFNNMIKDNYNGKEKYELLNDIKDNFCLYFNNNYLSFKFKLMLFLIKYLKPIYILILKRI